VYLVGFYYKNNITMHGPLNVKFYTYKLKMAQVPPKTCCQQILTCVMRIVICDLWSYSSITVCYHNGMNKAKTVAIIFTFHDALQMNVQFFRANCVVTFCRVLASLCARLKQMHKDTQQYFERHSRFLFHPQ